jgi:Cytochrome c3
MIRFWRFALYTAIIGLIFSAAFAATAPVYFRFQHGQGCEGCHEMAAHVNAVHASSHRGITCLQCHSASVADKLRHLRVHFNGQVPEEIRLRDIDVLAMTANCQSCHQHEFAAWKAGPHSATYAQIFTDPNHNAERRLTDDCLRCHGMHFSGSLRELVQPQNTSGPWDLENPKLINQPTIPCMACHQLHREGTPQSRPTSRISVATHSMQSLAFFDRREQMHFAAAQLALPQLSDGPRTVKASPDQRQSLCYQCHAPRLPETATIAATSQWGAQIGSGDDRTPTGVHEGISCFSCHAGHNESATASCKTCHPQMSHCGIDVEKMDTTFASAKSTHNIHRVRCTDCHQHGIPKPKTVAQHAAVSTNPRPIESQ